MSQTTKLFVCLLAICLFAGMAMAANEPADTLKVDYFSNANTAGSSDATVRISNVGTSGGNLCAAVYVYDSQQELSECCSCLLTPNGLKTLSVDTDLTKNPLTGVTLTTGDIRIVSSAPQGGKCPLPYIGKVTPTAGLRSWATHIQNGGAVTETASQDATFSSSEFGALTNACYAVYLVGSGSGQCTCGTGD